MLALFLSLSPYLLGCVLTLVLIHLGFIFIRPLLRVVPNARSLGYRRLSDIRDILGFGFYVFTLPTYHPSWGSHCFKEALQLSLTAMVPSVLPLVK